MKKQKIQTEFMPVFLRDWATGNPRDIIQNITDCHDEEDLQLDLWKLFKRGYPNHDHIGDAVDVEQNFDLYESLAKLVYLAFRLGEEEGEKKDKPGK